MSNFTKGPWVKCKRGESLVGSSGKNIMIYNCGLSGSGKTSESVANAHLIAAAPDMYSLLNDILSNYETDTHIDNQINVVLAKARGEQ